TGTVTDPQGAAVPDAKVTATNQGTKLEYNAKTSDSGVYTIPFLPVGVYVINAEKSGFKKIASNDIKLEVNQIARVNLELTVGQVSEIVNVQDVAPILQTENVTVGSVITGQTATNLPLNGRNFQSLTLLVPGSITPNPRGMTGAGQQAQGRPYVNGNREQGNSFLLDGLPVDETIDNQIGYKPSVDALAEFRVETSNSSSEFGNVTGAIVNAPMKSGTNNYHGNVFEFLRNDKLDANQWENNRNNGRDANGKALKQKLRQNVFGGTLGGPIIKEKFFFFTDYQGTKQRGGGNTSVNVASPDWRAGNLASITTPIRDPQKTGLCTAADRTACFPGNVIPTNRIINPAAKALFADNVLYPQASRIDAATGLGIYNTSTASAIDGFQFDVKLDARFSEKDNLSGRYSFGNYNSLGSRGAFPLAFPGKSFSRPQSIVFNYTRSISSTIINEARVGMNRTVFIDDVNDWAKIGNGNAKLGIPGSQAFVGVSAITLGNGLSGVGTRVVTSDNVSNNFLYGDNLTILRGRHSFKMGGQLLHYQQNRFYPGNNGILGGFTYDGRFTGSAYADFLLDLLSNKSIGSQTGSWGHRQNRWGIFFQDDYKVRSNFTINLGLRWEYTSPVVEVKDRQSSFALFSGKQLFAGRDGNSRALYAPFYKGYEPRIGFAWTPDMFKNKLVVRAGYGITQFMEGTGANLRLPLNPPFFNEADQTYDQTTGAGTITRGFTDVIVRNTPNGQIRVWDPKLRPQFTQQYNLTLEYALNSGTSFSAAYVGNNATHLVAPTDWNQPLPGTDPDPTKWAPLNSRRPLFPVLPLITQISGTASWGVSRYNSLQMSMRQRSSKGLEFLASYTLSKTMTDNLGYYGSGGVAAQGAYSANHYDRRGYNYGPAFFDAKHNFVWSGSYELPVGKGKSFGGDMHPVINAIIGGWSLSNIVQFRTGFPITVTAADVSLQGGRGTARPNLVGNPVPSNQTVLRAARPMGCGSTSAHSQILRLVNSVQRA
ncbi:MAG: TonB-dependent receptor, partial [Acidobacteria bacterium]|nr:TonB-dependent receptor [Acidobacteriota bacterium]